MYLASAPTTTPSFMHKWTQALCEENVYYIGVFFILFYLKYNIFYW